MTTFNLQWPQIVWLVLMAMSVGATVMKHGEPINIKYSMWLALFRVILMGTLLWFGGFFHPVHAQLLRVVLP